MVVDLGVIYSSDDDRSGVFNRLEQIPLQYPYNSIPMNISYKVFNTLMFSVSWIAFKSKLSPRVFHFTSRTKEDDNRKKWPLPRLFHPRDFVLTIMLGGCSILWCHISVYLTWLTLYCIALQQRAPCSQGFQGSHCHVHRNDNRWLLVQGIHQRAYVGRDIHAPSCLSRHNRTA